LRSCLCRRWRRHVSYSGILFETAAFVCNLYSTGPTTYFLSTFNQGSFNPGDPGSLAVAETPLPPALLLFGSALVGLGRRNRQQRKVVAATAA